MQTQVVTLMKVAELQFKGEGKIGVVLSRNQFLKQHMCSMFVVKC